MAHLAYGMWLFLLAVFGHWQIWLSGSGIGGFVVIATTLLEQLLGRSLSRKTHFAIFVVAFFLCSCLLAWIDEHDEWIKSTTQLQVSMQSFNQHQIDCARQLGELRQGLAVKDAVGQTLERQNRDQQSTINGCLSQAMKLLTPEAQKTTALVLHSKKGDKPVIEWILVTNKMVEHPRMYIECNRPLESSYLSIVGTGTMGFAENRMSQNAFYHEIISPAWSPTSPLYAKLAYSGAPEIACKFIVR